MRKDGGKAKQRREGLVSVRLLSLPQMYLWEIKKMVSNNKLQQSVVKLRKEK